MRSILVICCLVLFGIQTVHAQNVSLILLGNLDSAQWSHIIDGCKARYYTNNLTMINICDSIISDFHKHMTELFQENKNNIDKILTP